MVLPLPVYGDMNPIMDYERCKLDLRKQKVVFDVTIKDK